MTQLKHILPFLAVAVVSGGCRKELQFTEDRVQLEFSQDTVAFDTVFTTLSTSVTKRFTVRNPNDQAVKVHVELQGGAPSPFRINVDGGSGTSFDDVEIYGKDSIFVFVEVLPGAGNVNTPFVVEDHILFNTNGNVQSVLLTAWGQDALFYPNENDTLWHVNGYPPFSYIAGGPDPNGNQICETVHWTNEKPIVLLNYAVVDSCCQLIIDPGTRIYVHGGGGLWVYKYGQIIAEGTQEEHIMFQSDRLEPAYADLPGQWDRIWINEGNTGIDQRFDHVDIRNALIGIQCETFPLDPTAPTSEAVLQLNNVSIRNCSAAGILSHNYRVTSTNLLVANCGQYAIALTGGGQYRFDHTTVANYWGYDVRQTPSFAITNAYDDITGTTQIREILTSTFTNAIIYGANTKEFQLELDNGAPTDLTFDHFLVRTDEPTNDSALFPDQGSIWRNQDPAFVSSDGDYHLTANSVARNKATAPTIEAILDLDGVDRTSDGQYDLGCYEYVP
ncbi:MAG: hypothetical protein H6597_06210 [Flavobacteriales bacterium]|nr:hypothetical protein [Flavobacteriales bacterium]MCB9194108.1 hypothetical protein [Flavobacteriales bacterium]